MNTLSITASTLAHSFSYALLYSLGQGLIIYGLLFIVLRAFPGMNARTKYYLSFGALTAMFLWFADTCIDQYAKFERVTVYITQQASPGTSPDISSPVTVATATPDRFFTLGNLIPQLEGYVPVIIFIYCLGLAFMLLRFVINIYQLRSLVRDGISAPSKGLADFVSRWQDSLGIVRRVQLLVSEKVSVPIMLGAFKPVILLPVAAVNNLSTEEVEAILLHELAHIKRHDYLFNLFQAIIETLLFFNPFIWLISAIIRTEREHCCDDVVLAGTANPLQYARALTQLEDNRINSNSLALAATGHKKQLFHRIKRIMEMKKDNLSHSRVSAIILAVLITTFLSAMIAFTPSFAQKAKDEKKAPQKKVATETVTVDSTGKRKIVTKTTTTAGKPGKNDDEDVAINVSITGDDDKKPATAKVTVVASCDDGKGGKDKKKMKKQIVVSSAGGGNYSFSESELESELAEAKRELESVDWDAIKREITTALASVEEIDVDEISRQIKKEMDNAKRQIANSKRQLANSKRELAISRKEMAESERDRARSHRAIAKVYAGGAAYANADGVEYGSNDVESMLSKMDEEGLIDRNSKFRIEKENEILYINGEKQPDKVYHKYSRYLHGKEVTIKGSKNNLNINVSN